MKTLFITTEAVVICVLSFCVLPAEAKLVPIAITAEVTEVSDSGPLKGRINVGDLITGVYVYDSSTLDSDPSENRGVYEQYAPSAGVTLTVGGFVFMTDPENVELNIHIYNDPPVIGGAHENYGFDSRNNLPLPNGRSVDLISLSLYNSSSVLNAISSDELPTTAPVLDDWGNASVTVRGGGGIRTGGTPFRVTGHLTSAVLIPEPATIILLGLGGLVLLRKKIA